MRNINNFVNNFLVYKITDDFQANDTSFSMNEDTIFKIEIEESFTNTQDVFDYEIEMFDSYGDGWNGGYLEIVNIEDPNLRYGAFSLSSGSEGSETVGIKNGMYNIIYNGGYYPSEISWTIKTLDGDEILSGSGASNNFNNILFEGGGEFIKVHKEPTNGVFDSTNLTYKPNLDYNGEDSFEIKYDNGSVSGISKINVLINPIDDALKGVDKIFKSMVMNNKMELLKNDTLGDIDNPTTHEIIEQPSNGAVSFSEENIIYKPNFDFIGIDKFKVKCENDVGESKETEFNIEIFNSEWNQIGSTIKGDVNEDIGKPHAMAINKDGTILAYGSELASDTRGKVKIMKIDNDEWKQLGYDIEGEYVKDHAGGVSLNAKGDTVAILSSRTLRNPSEIISLNQPDQSDINLIQKENYLDTRDLITGLFKVFEYKIPTDEEWKTKNIIMENSSFYFTHEGPSNLLSLTPEAKYVNYGKTNTNLIIASKNSIVRSLTLTGSNENIERDPTSFILYGDDNKYWEGYNNENEFWRTNYFEDFNNKTINDFIRINDITIPGQATSSTSNYPANETPIHAIDNNVLTKYLNFDGDTGNPQSLKDLVDIILTTSGGIVTGIDLTSANDAPERDPSKYKLYGLNAVGTYELISEGDIPLFTYRYETKRILFDNKISYIKYKLAFPNTAGLANSMQIAEIKLIVDGSAKSHNIMEINDSDFNFFDYYPEIISKNGVSSLQLLKLGSGVDQNYLAIPGIANSSKGWRASIDFSMNYDPTKTWKPSDGFSFNYIDPQGGTNYKPNENGFFNPFPKNSLSFCVDIHNNSYATTPEDGYDIKIIVDGGINKDYSIRDTIFNIGTSSVVEGKIVIIYNPSNKTVSYKIINSEKSIFWNEVSVGDFKGNDNYEFMLGGRTGLGTIDLLINSIKIETINNEDESFPKPNWIEIAKGEINLPENRDSLKINISNNKLYNTYKLAFPTIRDNETANAVQLSKLELNDSNDNNILTPTNLIRASTEITKKEGYYWVQKGQSIEGPGKHYGKISSIKLNGLGNRLVISRLGRLSDALVSVYDYDKNENIWKTIGTFVGKDDTVIGFSLDFNFNGDVLAIGSKISQDTQISKWPTGEVNLYKYTEENNWSLIKTFFGKQSADGFGNSVSLNDEGDILAIGAPYYDKESNNTGRTYIYKLNELNELQESDFSMTPDLTINCGKLNQALSFWEYTNNTWVYKTIYEDSSYLLNESETNSYTSSDSRLNNYHNIYKSERWSGSAVKYSISELNGEKLDSTKQYKVVLHFAEIYHSSENRRAFNVKLNGELLQEDLDIVKEVGSSHTPLTITKIVKPTTSGTIDISVEKGSLDNPKINGIEIFKETLGEEKCKEEIIEIEGSPNLSFGDSVSLNGKGDIISIGAVGADIIHHQLNNKNVGSVTICKYEDNKWIQHGKEILGEVIKSESDITVTPEMILEPTPDYLNNLIEPVVKFNSHLTNHVINSKGNALLYYEYTNDKKGSIKLYRHNIIKTEQAIEDTKAVRDMNDKPNNVSAISNNTGSVSVLNSGNNEILIIKTKDKFMTITDVDSDKIDDIIKLKGKDPNEK